MGDRKDAVERLRRANALFAGLRAAPFIARTEEELAACHLPASPAKKQSVLALTSRETEVAHLVGKGLSNRQIAAELFISRKAVEYPPGQSHDPGPVLRTRRAGVNAESAQNTLISTRSAEAR